MKEAILYDRLEEGLVHCLLCAHRCKIPPGLRGRCGVRENRDGTLHALAYGKIIAINDDPIEKKPIFHMLPGSRSLSISTVGCNLRCLHCQNADISQYPIEHPGAGIPGRSMSPEAIVGAAMDTGCRSIAYTYTEPTIFMEFALDTASLARERGLKNIFVSNGYMSPEAVEAISPLLDADNIDLKGPDEFYKNVCGARLAPVLRTIEAMKARGVWVEVTTLLIPGHNDSREAIGEVTRFLASLDKDIPWHISRYHPAHRLTAPVTPLETLLMAREIGREAGLKYIYVGNVHGGRYEDTLCPSCGAELIVREGFSVTRNALHNGVCPLCKAAQPGVWV